MPYFVECFRYIKKNASSNPPSKPLKMPCVIANNWLMQKLPVSKSDCLEQIRLLSKKCLNSLINKYFKYFPKHYRKRNRSPAFHTLIIPFLRHWHWICFFYFAGKIPRFKQDLITKFDQQKSPLMVYKESSDNLIMQIRIIS